MKKLADSGHGIYLLKMEAGEIFPGTNFFAPKTTAYQLAAHGNKRDYGCCDINEVKDVNNTTSILLPVAKLIKIDPHYHQIIERISD